MTGPKGLNAIPTLKIQGGDFMVDLEPYSLIAPNASKILVVCQNEQERLINSRLQLVGRRHYLVFSIPELCVPLLTKASLILDGSPVDITGAFIRYQLDRDKWDDNNYLTRAVFNAGARSLSDDDLYVVSYAYLNSMPLDNANFGGFITLLAYRITDQLDSRAQVLDNVYMTYRQYRDMVRCHDALAFRWLVSSSSALTTALLSVGRVEQAEDVADGALRLVIHPGFNPMAHQNYTLLLFQAGLIKAWFERYDEAASLFIGAVNASRYGMVDLLHPQNNWVLGQMNDCLKFLHVAEAAYLAAVACTQNKLPPPSRFAPLSSAPKLKINFSTLFERFGCFKSGSPAFFGQVLLKMQAHQDS